MSTNQYTSTCLGSLFAAGTAYVLFSDVHNLSAITVDHVCTALVLIGTIAAGHLFGVQLRQWRLLSAFGLAVLFVTGTFYCVTSSAARNAEVSVNKTGDVTAANEERKRLTTDRDEAKSNLKDQLKIQSRECASGEGPRCKSATKLVEAAKASLASAETTLSAAAPAREANAGLRHAATVFAIFGGEADAIEHALVLLFPFAKAVFLEIATIVFLGIGMHRPGNGQKVAQSVTVASDEVTSAKEPVAFAKPVQRSLTKEEALRVLKELGEAPSQQLLCHLFGRDRATVHRWLRDWQRNGEVSKERNGKRKQLLAAPVVPLKALPAPQVLQ
jgi:hypothetical protein